jgi:hypothetical protein
MEVRKDLRLAVLIDADNVPYSNIKGMMEEIAKYGTPTFKRIYGDWTKPTLSGWKNVLLENAITPIQQYNYSSGKNASDSALIIDAMDILYTGRVDGFCIVSSDSDFTRLATRLREAGMVVYGIGERKTLTPFISACDKFIYLEILSDKKNVSAPEAKATTKSTKEAKAVLAGPAHSPILTLDAELLNLITESINDIADDDGWAFLGDLGNLLLKKQPNFDPRNYGYSKLVPLIRSTGQFLVIEKQTGNKKFKHVFVKNKTNSV